MKEKDFEKLERIRKKYGHNSPEYFSARLSFAYEMTNFRGGINETWTSNYFIKE